MPPITTTLRRWASRTTTAAFALTVLLLPAVQAPPPAHAAALVVNTLADANPPATDGQCSLREAITNANANAATWPDCAAGAGTGADTITFSLSGTIVLAAALPDLADPAGTVIEGAGQQVVVDGNLSVRILTVEVGANVQVANVELRRGRAAFGSLVRNLGSLVLRGCTLSQGVGELGSGAVENAGVMALVGSTVVSNQGSSTAAGINNAGSLAVTNSTIAFNIMLPGGVPASGGLLNTGSLAIRNSTILGNVGWFTALPVRTGGGIANLGGVVSLDNSILAFNRMEQYPSVDGDNQCLGTITTSSKNILNRPSCSFVGVPPLIVDPNVEPLADNGGPSHTFALKATSPALNTGDPSVCASSPVNSVDQRGVSRPGPSCDIGSYESALPGYTMGGKNLRITAETGVQLAWDPGNLQKDYRILQYNTATAGAELYTIGSAATSFTDPFAVSNTLLCYLVGGNGPDWLGNLSDLECALFGLASGLAQPGAFTLVLNQSPNATLTWSTPAGGADGYFLVTIPLDGSPVLIAPVASSVTTVTEPAGAAGSCYQLAAYNTTNLGVTNILCGIPGISNLGTNSRTVDGVMEQAMAPLQGRLSDVALRSTEAIAALTSRVKAEAVLGIE